MQCQTKHAINLNFVAIDKQYWYLKSQLNMSRSGLSEGRKDHVCQTCKKLRKTYLRKNNCPLGICFLQQKIDAYAHTGAKSTDRDKLTANQRFPYSDFVNDFVAALSSLSEGLGKMAFGIVKIYLGLLFSANQSCLQPVCLRSVCRSQLLWTLCTSVN